MHSAPTACGRWTLAPERRFPLAPANQLPEATMSALGAKTQSLTLAADIIWHF
jgi:hypothetical protein